MLNFLALIAAIGSVYSINISSCPLTHAEAVAFCAAQGSYLASVNVGNVAVLGAQAGNSPKWVGSWNGDSYNGACLTLNQGTVVTADCHSKYQAMCNSSPQPCPVPQPCPPAPQPCPPAPHPSESCSSSSSNFSSLPSCIDSSSMSSSSCVLPDPEPFPMPCEYSSSILDLLSSSYNNNNNNNNNNNSYGPRRSSRSSRSRQPSSSSSRCHSSSESYYGGCEVPFQYVYLTNTITNSYTSVQSITTTTTSTEIVFFATVAAYTVTLSTAT